MYRIKYMLPDEPEEGRIQNAPVETRAEARIIADAEVKKVLGTCGVKLELVYAGLYHVFVKGAIVGKVLINFCA